MMDIPHIDDKGLRQFGLITGLIVVLLFALLFPWVFDAESMPIWPWSVAAVLWLPALLMPSILRPVYKGWMRVGHVLGWVNTRILLGIVFYVVLMPMGLVMRLAGYDPLARKRDMSSTSYRVESTDEPKDRLEKPY